MLNPNSLNRALRTALVLATLTCSHIAHAVLVTGSFDGSITTGRTYVSNTFGNARNLAGRAVTGSFSYQTDPTGVYGYEYSHTGHYVSNTDSWLTITVAIDGIDVPITTSTQQPSEWIRTYNTANYDRLEFADRNGYTRYCMNHCYGARNISDLFRLTLHDYTGNSLTDSAIPDTFNMTSGYGTVNIVNYRSWYCGRHCGGSSHYPESLYAHFSLDNVTFNPVSVPEPGTLGLLAVGLLGLGLARRIARH